MTTVRLKNFLWFDPLTANVKDFCLVGHHQTLTLAVKGLTYMGP